MQNNLLANGKRHAVSRKRLTSQRLRICESEAPVLHIFRSIQLNFCPNTMHYNCCNRATANLVLSEFCLQIDR